MLCNNQRTNWLAAAFWLHLLHLASCLTLELVMN